MIRERGPEVYALDFTTNEERYLIGKGEVSEWFHM